MSENEKPPTNIIPFPVTAIECPTCRGKGLVTGFTGRIKSEHRCPSCGGSGKVRVR